MFICFLYIDGRPPVQGKGQIKRQIKQMGFSVSDAALLVVKVVVIVNFYHAQRRIKRLLQEIDAAKTPEQTEDSTMADATEQNEQEDPVDKVTEQTHS